MAEYSTEYKQMLDGFEQRMRFIGIAKCLTGYAKPDAVRAATQDSDALDNLIVAVFVFIMEQTLRYNAKCTLDDIGNFIATFSPAVGIAPEHAPLLAKHIVVTVLQNGGQPQVYRVWDSKSGTMIALTLRLIAEERGSYHLTDDACDFLFRTKEVDAELDFSVARFKLKELLKRENYEDAQAQSWELITRIRSMRSGMEDFLYRCRENMGLVTVDAYEKLIGDIRKLLENEEAELETIQGAAKERLKLFADSAPTKSEAETERAEEALREIIQNIATAIQEQRGLINRRHSLRELYRQLIQDSFSTHNFERFNLEKELLQPFRQPDCDWEQMKSFAAFAFAPLCTPQLNPFFSIEDFYAPQRKITTEAEDDEIELALQEDPAQARREARDARYLHIIESLLTYMSHHSRFTAGAYLQSLPLADFMEQCRENCLPQVILTLYEMQTISIEDWQARGDLVFEANGEFNLPWALSRISEQGEDGKSLLEMREIHIYHSDKIFSVAIDTEGEKRKMSLTDFEFEVIGR